MKIILCLILLPCLVLAQPQQSENFRLAKSVLDAGGAASTSNSFRLLSAFGQPTPIGVTTSASFTLSAGFLSPVFALSPLSPIQELVIHYNSPDVRLLWGRIAGVAQYTVYRSTNPLFTPSPTSLLGTTSDTTYTDANIISLPAGRNFYIVTASNAGGALIAIPQRRLDAATPTTTKKMSDGPTLRVASKAVAKK